IAGGGVNRSGAAAVVARLQELAAVPVATTNMGKGTVDETDPLSAGVIGTVMGQRSPTHFLRDWVRDADLVVFVGTRTNENGTDGWSLFGERTRFIHIDVDGAEIGRNYSALRLVGDARATLEDLCDVLEQTDLDARIATRSTVAATLAEAKDRYV